MAERPNFWVDTESLTERLQVPEDRLKAVLNILQNGAQTLTVLSMLPDIHHWESPASINRRMTDTVGVPVVHRKTTLQHLVQTIEPVGLAARSTINDDEWAITEFGITSRAALIFAWQRFMNMAIDPMMVLGNVSKGEKDEQGNLVTTPPEARFKILRALPTGTTRTIKAVADEIRIAEPAVSDHIDVLGQNGFLAVNVYDRNSQKTVTSYSLTERGQAVQEWPIYANTKQNHPSLSNEVRSAISHLTSQNIPINIPEVTSYIASLRGKTSLNPGLIPSVLAYWARGDIGLLEKSGAAWNENSDVTVAPLGDFIFRHVLHPLSNWSGDNRSVAEINVIDQELRRNNLAFRELRQEIAQSFINNSPAKNRDAEGKMALVRNLVNQHPGQYSQADIARLTGTSPNNMGKVVRGLMQTDEVFLEPAERGSKLLLYPKPY